MRTGNESVLLPCPLCGSELTYDFDYTLDMFAVRCSQEADKCCFGVFHFDTMDDAIEHLNRRPPRDKSSEPPTEPGWYWWETPHYKTIVEVVRQGDGTLWVCSFTHDVELHLFDRNRTGQWSRVEE